MNNPIHFYGHVDEEGRLKIHDITTFKGYIESHFKKTNVTLTIEKTRRQFSDGMRAYYFGVLLASAQKAFRRSGEIVSREELDEYFRDKFLATEVIDPLTWEISRERTTLKKDKNSPISQSVFREYCELIIIWVAQNLDYPIPYPGEDVLKDLVK